MLVGVMIGLKARYTQLAVSIFKRAPALSEEVGSFLPTPHKFIAPDR